MTDTVWLFEKLEDAYDKIERGEAWLRDHPRTHPQYRQAVARLEQRRSEAAEREAQAKLANAQDWARDSVHGLATPAPSLNCQACGKLVRGWPTPAAGHYIHISCTVNGKLT